MSKRHRLGQHFLISQSVAQSIVSVANITKNDVVLEIGTGKGILVPFLCKKAERVISYESDKRLYLTAKSKFANFDNLTLKYGNGFKTQENFTIFVSNLPYSQSRHALEWLIQKKFSHAVIMVQKEFAQKLLAEKKNRKALSVLVTYTLDIKKLMDIKKNNFDPPPKINSVVLKLARKRTISIDLIKNVNKLFSYRRKTIQNIFKQFGQIINSNQRLDDLSGDDIIKIAKKISRT